MIKKTYKGMNNFISNNKDVAFSWAAFFTRDRECYINNEKYHIEYLFNAIICFTDNTYIEGNYFKYTNLKTKETAYLKMEDARNIRKENPLKSDLICFNENQFLKVS
jgi:hypothetical protein